MGDTGSLIIGMILVLTFKFIEFNQLEPNSIYMFQSARQSLLVYFCFPLYDTLRVFILRIANTEISFYPDRRHIHHMLIDFGFLICRRHLFELVLACSSYILYINYKTSDL